MDKNKISNVIYNAIIGICEDREANGSYKGNGHHLAQEITEAIVKALLNNITDMNKIIKKEDLPNFFSIPGESP